MKAIPKPTAPFDVIQWTGENEEEVDKMLQSHGGTVDWAQHGHIGVSCNRGCVCMDRTEWLVFSRSPPLILSDAEFHQRYELRPA